MNEEIKIGSKAIVKVGRNEVEVAVLEILPDGKYSVKSIATGREFSVKQIERIIESPPEKADVIILDPVIQEPVRGKKNALINVAASILESSDRPMNCKELVKLALESGLCNPFLGGTPEQSLYSSIFREMSKRGTASRFRRSETVRGAFEFNK